MNNSMIEKKHLIGKTVSIVQKRSSHGLVVKKKSNLIGLGLRGIGSNSTLICSESVFGMIKKVEHLVQVSVK